MKKIIIVVVFIILISMLIYISYNWVIAEIRIHDLSIKGLTTEDVSYINSIRQTSVSIIASLLLSIITIMYVLYAKIMVEETKKMAKGTLKIAALNDRLWRHNVMPLFYCLKPELEFHPGASSSITIKNIGGLALLVEVAVSFLGNKKIFAIFEHGVEKDLPFGVPIQEDRSQQWKKAMVITISFQDKAACRYIQILKYEFTDDKWIFTFKESNLPVVSSS